ncbi:non-ribosomal peptide synthetase [Rhodospirillum sp. A1_3_36]|uniref:non-ribosomal peptide synthetase n=1 Tax=Rhodospirillum sp. A1_3_36 TaxID=3391666 RepID=UPI0039A6461A
MSTKALISDEQIQILASESLWGPNPGYRIVHTIEIDTPVSSLRLQAALEVLTRRHDGLRSTFHGGEDGFHRRVHERITLDHGVLVPATGAGERVGDIIAREADRLHSLDMATDRPPVWRVRELRFPEGPVVLILVVHHVIADGWSMALLAEEIATILSQGAEILPPPLSFDRHVEARASTGDKDTAVTDAPPSPGGGVDVPPLHWPGLDADPKADPQAADWTEITVEGTFGQHLRAFSARRRRTPNTILLAAWTAVLARLGDGGPIPVSWAVSMRNSRDQEGIFGPCLLTVTPRLPIDEDQSFEEHLAAIGRVMTEIRRSPTHFAAPRAPRDPGAEDPARLSTFAVHPGGRRTFTVGDLTIRHGDHLIRGAVGAVDLFAYEEGGNWRFLMIFRKTLMGRPDADWLLEAFRRLLTAALDAPETPIGALPVAPDTPDGGSAPADDPRSWIRGPEAPSIGAGFVAGILARSRRTPRVTALFHRGKAMDFATLEARATALGHRLRALGVGPGHRVALRLRRSPAVAVGHLAVRMLGAAFVPLDPDVPPARQGDILATTAPRALVDGEPSPDGVTDGVFDGPTLHIDSFGQPAEPSGQPVSGGGEPFPPAPFDPEEEAYVLFTSGSTGRPKGVSCSEGAILRQVLNDTGQWCVTDRDRVLALAPPTFDLSILEFWTGLLAGQGLVIVGPEETSDAALARFIQTTGVTVISMVPRVFHELLTRFDAVFDRVRLALVGGDINSPADFSHCAQRYPGLSLVAIYGPTEAGVSVTGWRAGSTPFGRAVPIGAALAGSRLLLVDHRGRPRPPGVPGEILIGGPCVERGYLSTRRDGESGFRPDPLDPAGRCYASGDLAVRDRHGMLLFHGRRDRQMKLGGYRIEPAEVEDAIRAHGEVTQCAVLPLSRSGSEAGVLELAAVIVPSPGADGPGLMSALRHSLTDRLPPHMVPSRFMTIDHLPRSDHGKTDLDALTALIRAQSAPASDTARRMGGSYLDLVLDLASQALGRTDLTATMAYFAIGGHSLNAIGLCAALSEAVGTRVSPRVLFECGTFGALAERLRDLVGGDADPITLPPFVPKGAAWPPASDSQRRLLESNQRRSGKALPVLPLVFAIAPPMDRDRLERALDLLVDAHPILASHFETGPDGETVSVPGPRAPLQVIDLSSVPRADREAFMRGTCHIMLATWNDLRSSPPLRAVLFAEGNDAPSVLLLLIDHAAHDGRSISILRRDLARAHGRGYIHAPTEFQRPTFGDYALWEREIKRSGLLAKLAARAAAHLAPKGPSPWSARRLEACQTLQCMTVTSMTFDLGPGDLGPGGTGWHARTLGVTGTAAIYALLTECVMTVLGVEALRLCISSSTRVAPSLFDTIGPFINHAYIDVARGPSVRATARAIQREMLFAQDHAVVPILDLLKAVETAAPERSRMTQLPDLFLSLFDHGDVEDGDGDGQDGDLGNGPMPTSLRPLDESDGWDPQAFHFNQPIAILAQLTGTALTLRFAVHPAIGRPSLAETFERETRRILAPGPTDPSPSFHTGESR